jgi:hypothetical protein
MYPQSGYGTSPLVSAKLPQLVSPGAYRELPEVGHPVHVARARAFAGPLDDVLEV